MINRRLIRVKVLQSLYSFFQSGENSFDRFEKELFYSIQKTYDLYYYLLLLLLDIHKFSCMRIDTNKRKLVPTEEDLNPNTKFIDNKIIQQLKENQQFAEYLKANKMSWVNYPELIKNLYKNIAEDETFKNFLSSENTNYEADKKILIYILENILNESEELSTALEEQSIYWNDSIDFIISMIVKTIKKMKVGDSTNTLLMGKFKNDEDKEFVSQLFRKAIYNQKEHREIINHNIKNWDIDRLAYIDLIILQLAITELLLFSEIPVKVTINEYIEISKYYSTEKSSTFINGILDKMIKVFKDENKINKVGRGLIGEIESEDLT